MIEKEIEKAQKKLDNNNSNVLLAGIGALVFFLIVVVIVSSYEPYSSDTAPGDNGICWLSVFMAGILFAVSGHLSSNTNELENELNRLNTEKQYLVRKKETDAVNERRKDDELARAGKLKSLGGIENLRKAIKIYEFYSYKKHLVVTKEKIAKEYEDVLKYEDAIKELEDIGYHSEAKRIRQKVIEQKKVDQTVVQGDHITKTEIKDSVLNRSNVGSNSEDKFAKLERLTGMKKEGLISDEEYEKMKQEIIG